MDENGNCFFIYCIIALAIVNRCTPAAWVIIALKAGRYRERKRGTERQSERDRWKERGQRGREREREG